MRLLPMFDHSHVISSEWASLNFTVMNILFSQAFPLLPLEALEDDVQRVVSHRFEGSHSAIRASILEIGNVTPAQYFSALLALSGVDEPLGAHEALVLLELVEAREFSPPFLCVHNNIEYL